MCQAKPGLRCSTHAKERLATLHAVIKEEHSVTALEELEEARFQYKLTPAGLAEITDDAERARMEKVAHARRASARMIDKAEDGDLKEEASRVLVQQSTQKALLAFLDRDNTLMQAAVKSMEVSDRATDLRIHIRETKGAIETFCNQTGEPVSQKQADVLGEADKTASRLTNINSELRYPLEQMRNLDSYPEDVGDADITGDVTLTSGDRAEIDKAVREKIGMAIVSGSAWIEGTVANQSFIHGDPTGKDDPGGLVIKSSNVENSVVLGKGIMNGAHINGGLVTGNSDLYASTVTESTISGEAKVAFSTIESQSSIREEAEVFSSRIAATDVSGDVKVRDAAATHSEISGKGTVRGAMRYTTISLEDKNDNLPATAAYLNGGIRGSRDVQVVDPARKITVHRTRDGMGVSVSYVPPGETYPVRLSLQEASQMTEGRTDEVSDQMLQRLTEEYKAANPGWEG